MKEDAKKTVTEELIEVLQELLDKDLIAHKHYAHYDRVIMALWRATGKVSLWLHPNTSTVLEVAEDKGWDNYTKGMGEEEFFDACDKAYDEALAYLRERYTVVLSDKVSPHNWWIFGRHKYRASL